MVTDQAPIRGVLSLVSSREIDIIVDSYSVAHSSSYQPVLDKLSFLSNADTIFFTSAEREVKVSRRSGMYQSYNFLTRLGMQSL